MLSVSISLELAVLVFELMTLQYVAVNLAEVSACRLASLPTLRGVIAVAVSEDALVDFSALSKRILQKGVLIWIGPDVFGRRTELEGDGLLDALFQKNMKYQPSLGFSGAVCPWF